MRFRATWALLIVACVAACTSDEGGADARADAAVMLADALAADAAADAAPDAAGEADADAGRPPGDDAADGATPPDDATAPDAPAPDAGSTTAPQWQVPVGPVTTQLPLAITHIDANGADVLVAGWFVPTGDQLTWLALRRAADGTAVLTFGDQGEQTRPDLADPPAIATSSAAFHLFATRVGGPRREPVIERLRRSDATVTATFDPATGAPRDLARQGGSLFLLVDRAPGGWLLTRHDALDLMPDPTFVASGTVSGQRGRPLLAVDGAAAHVFADGTPWVIERRALADGAREARFTGAGTPLGFAAGASGYYLALFDPQSTTSRVERRAAAGALDPAFGTGGVVTWASGEVSGVALDGGRLYVFGRAAMGAQLRLRVEARSPIDGALDPSFANGGVWQNEDGMSGYVTAMGFDGTGIYLGAVARPMGESVARAWLIKLAR